MPTPFPQPAPGAAAAIAAQTRAVVEQFLAARMAGDTARLASLFAPEVDWHIAPNPAAPWIRPRHTAAECAAQVTDLLAHTVAEDARVTLDAFLVDGIDAVLTGHLAGTVRATGRSFGGPFALRLSVEGGRITRHHLYEDGLSIAQACTAGRWWAVRGR